MLIDVHKLNTAVLLEEPCHTKSAKGPHRAWLAFAYPSGLNNGKPNAFTGVNLNVHFLSKEATLHTAKSAWTGENLIGKILTKVAYEIHDKVIPICSYTRNPRRKCPLYDFKVMGRQIPIKFTDTLYSQVYNPFFNNNTDATKKNFLPGHRL